MLVLSIVPLAVNIVCEDQIVCNIDLTILFVNVLGCCVCGFVFSKNAVLTFKYLFIVYALVYCCNILNSDTLSSFI